MSLIIVVAFQLVHLTLIYLHEYDFISWGKGN